MTSIPAGGRWTSPNNSDKFGSLWYTKNINADESGYLKLSPRTIRLMTEVDDGNYDFAVGINKIADGLYLSAHGTGSVYDTNVSKTANSHTENTGTNNPTVATTSGSAFFQGLYHTTTATTVVSKDAANGATATWTDRVTGLTSGVQHVLEVFHSRVSLCVSNKNVLKQYNSSYSNTTDLTIPSDFEISGLAYNKGRMGVITRLDNDGTYGQDQDARFYIWDGASTGAQTDASIGSDAGVGIIAYKESFVVINRAGELLYWNGGGFTRLAAFPFYFQEYLWNTVQNNTRFGNVPMWVDGDVIYINIGTQLNAYGNKDETYAPQNPSGVWCYDPEIGLYHRYSASTSRGYVLSMSQAGVNTSTDTITVSAGTPSATIPATGNVIRLTSTAGIGGLTLYQNYYVIKVSSTEFKLALTKADALAGTAIDLTSATTGTNYFWAYDLVDYGATHYSRAGNINLASNITHVSKGVIFGTQTQEITSLDTESATHVAVPELENRGVIVLSKEYSDVDEDSFRSLSVFYRPLDTDEKILVKKKDKDVYGLPVSSTGTSGATWTNSTELYVTADLSEAKSYLDGGGELEIEIISGAGAGAYVRVLEINTDDDLTYSLVLEEEVLGAQSALMCHFVLENWELVGSVDNTNNASCQAVIPLGSVSKWILCKLELRGYEVTIEKLNMNGGAQKKAN